MIQHIERRLAILERLIIFLEESLGTLATRTD